MLYSGLNVLATVVWNFLPTLIGVLVVSAIVIYCKENLISRAGVVYAIVLFISAVLAAMSTGHPEVFVATLAGFSVPFLISFVQQRRSTDSTDRSGTGRG